MLAAVLKHHHPTCSGPNACVQPVAHPTPTEELNARYAEIAPNQTGIMEYMSKNTIGDYVKLAKNNFRAAAVRLAVVSLLLVSSKADAFSLNEIQLCIEATDAISVKTYTDKLQEYMTTKTGIVPAWLAAKAAKKVAGKSQFISATSSAAGELNDWCKISMEDDEVVRAGKAVAQLVGKTGPIGGVIQAQLGAGLTVLAAGSQVISKTNTLGQSSRSEVFFNVRVYVPRWYWTDRVKDKSETVSDVAGVYVIALVNNEDKIVHGILSTGDDCGIGSVACYKTVFDYPDEAAAAYAIRIDFNNGQRIYRPIGSLVNFVGEPVRTLKIDSSLVEQGATYFLPR